MEVGSTNTDVAVVGSLCGSIRVDEALQAKLVLSLQSPNFSFRTSEVAREVGGDVLGGCSALTKVIALGHRIEVS